jgi:hypothetical protein
MWWMAVSLVVSGCASEPADTPLPMPPPDGSAWALRVDTSASDRYLPSDNDTAVIRGDVYSSQGVDRIEIGPSLGAAVLPGEHEFVAPFSVGEGLSLVEMRAFDVDGHMANGHHAVLRTRYIPESELHPRAIAISLSEPLLASVSSGLLTAADGLELADFLTPGTALIDDADCMLIADRVTQSPTALSLRPTGDGGIAIEMNVRDVAIGFHGTCMGATVSPESEVDGTAARVTVSVYPVAPEPGECLSRFTATETRVEITSFDIDLRLDDCGVLCPFGEVVGELAEDSVRDRLTEQTTGMVELLLADFLSDVTLLDSSSTFDAFDVAVALDLCLTSIDQSGTELVARLGARASGPGGATDAPGAPQLFAELGPASANRAWLDPALLGQIVFSAWRAGGLTFAGGGDTLTTDLLGIVVPGLQERFDMLGVPRGSAIEVEAGVGMAPLLRAAAAPAGGDVPGEADVLFELGHVRTTLRAAGIDLFTFETHASLALVMTPDETGTQIRATLAPTSVSTTWLVDSAISDLDASASDLLALAVDSELRSRVADLASKFVIAVPDLGAPIVVTDVAPVEGGYLELTLAP